MKRKLTVFAAVLLALTLCGCAASAGSQNHPAAPAYPSASAHPSAPQPVSEPEAAVESVPEPAPAAEPEPEPQPVSANPQWSAEQTIEAYFAAHYESYLTMEDIDITGLLVPEKSDLENLTVWLKMLNQRRRLLFEHELCYVETEAFDYEIVYDENAEDDRMSFWQRRMNEQYDAVYHFRIKGEEGRAYPPTFALNSQHSIFLKKIDGAWRIARHYYPGAVRNFYFSGGLELLPDDEALSLLREEFAKPAGIAEIPVPQGAREYDNMLAAGYARNYAERPNELYYNVGDWRGNCQNFVSQAVSCGFGDDNNPNPMTYDWFAGSGGGSSPWENCDYFWAYAVEGGGIGGAELSLVTELREGDVMQIRSLGRNNPDDFSHVLMMVEPEKGVLAQNSPANFVYCSDLVNIAARFFRPGYLYANY